MASPRSDTSSETEKDAVRLRSTWGSPAAYFRAPTLSAVQGTPHRNSGCHSPPAGVRAPLAPTSTRIFTKSPSESRRLDSRTRLDASPPSALGRWAGSYARKDTEGSPGTAGTRQLLLGTQLAVHCLRSPAVGFSGLGKGHRLASVAVGVGAGSVKFGGLWFVSGIRKFASFLFQFN